MHLQIERLFSVIDFLGVFAGALAGALNAIRDTKYRYDFIGVTGLALVSALGGGITRDLIVQMGPPLAFRDARYLVLALTGAVAGMVLASRIGKNTNRALLLVDAAALGLFAVAGSTRALAAGLGPLPALLLGGVAAVGGGSLHDVLSGRTPRVFQPGQLYAIPALCGSLIFLLCAALKLSPRVSTILGILAAFTLRLLAWKYGWKTRQVGRSE